METHNSMKKRIINIVGLVMMVAAFGFLVKKFIELDVNLSMLISPKMLLAVVGMAIVQLLCIALMAHVWRLILGGFTSILPSWIETSSVFFKSNVGKYLPGNVGHFLGRQLLGASLGLTQSQLAATSIFETVFVLISGLLTSLIFGSRKLFETYRVMSFEHKKVLLVLIPCALAMLLAVVFLFKKYPSVKEIITRLRTKSFWVRATGIILLFCLQFLLIGAILAFLLRLSMPLSIADGPTIIAASTIAWLIGYITPGVPGGIGMRESVMLLVLTGYPQEIVLSTAIIQRVIMIAGDLLAWGFGMFLTRRKVTDGKHEKYYE